MDPDAMGCRSLDGDYMGDGTGCMLYPLKMIDKRSGGLGATHTPLMPVHCPAEPLITILAGLLATTYIQGLYWVRYQSFASSSCYGKGSEERRVLTA